MLRRHLTIWALSGMLLLPCLSQAQDEEKQTPPPPSEKADAEKEDPFKVPEGNDSSALGAYLQRIVRLPPEEPTPEGIIKHLNKIDKSLDTILSRDIEDDLYASAAQLRLQLYSAMPQFGDATAKAKRKEFLETLKNSKRPTAQKLAKRVEFQDKIQDVVDLKPEEQDALIQEVQGMVQSAEKGDDESLGFAIQMAMELGRTLEQVASRKAIDVYKGVASALEERQDDRFADLVANLNATVRRLQLPGNKIEISGKTIGGEQFNIDQYKGKVVLVDFWATWCGPCVAELPHVKEMYDAYHDKGFEVVGISLDNDRDKLEDFLSDEEIKWVTLFDDEAEQGWDNKLAQHYGISAIPTVILVNQEGKVVNMQARGENLTTELAKLLGPVELPEKDKAEGDSTESAAPAPKTE